MYNLHVVQVQVHVYKYAIIAIIAIIAMLFKYIPIRAMANLVGCNKSNN
jgi:hypothetical protein